MIHLNDDPSNNRNANLVNIKKF